MTRNYKMTAVKRSLILAAVLALSGSAWAKKPSGDVVSGDLSPDRTSATVTVTAQCDPATQEPEGTLSVYIFQPSGRLLNLGIGNGTVNCDNNANAQDITVNAIPGLAFKPGPATLLIRLTTMDTATQTPVVSETGSRIDLRP